VWKLVEELPEDAWNHIFLWDSEKKEGDKTSCSHAHLTLFALVNIETPVLTYFAFYTRKNH